MIRRAFRAIRAIDEVAAPASTLLWWCLAALLVVTTLRGAAATPVHNERPEVSVGGVAVPGAALDVSVRGPAEAALQVYLPGLAHRRVPLRFDPQVGRHVGAIHIPADAPERGFCTLRVVGDGERDRRVSLGGPPRG
jgi:hypothetical protein